MAWLILLVSGLVEVAWAVGLKYTDGFTRLGPTALTVTLNLIAIGLLAVAMRTIPIGTAYAVWTGIGVMGTVLFGVLLFGETLSVARLACVALIVSGIVGLKILSPV